MDEETLEVGEDGTKENRKRKREDDGDSSKGTFTFLQFFSWIKRLGSSMSKKNLFYLERGQTDSGGDFLKIGGRVKPQKTDRTGMGNLSHAHDQG